MWASERESRCDRTRWTAKSSEKSWCSSSSPAKREAGDAPAIAIERSSLRQCESPSRISILRLPIRCPPRKRHRPRSTGAQNYDSALPHAFVRQKCHYRLTVLNFTAVEHCHCLVPGNDQVVDLLISLASRRAGRQPLGDEDPRPLAQHTR